MLLIGVALGGACREARPAEPMRIRLTTGTKGAGFNPLGEAIAQAYRRAFVGATVMVSESAGSVDNVEALERGDADVGLVFADVLYMAFSGRLAEGDPPFEHLRAMAALRITPLHLMVRRGSPIDSVDDLRGRRVALGPPGSGTALTAAMVLGAFDVPLEQLALERLPFKEAAARLIGGQLDAMFVDATYPAESIGDAAAAGARLIAIEGAPTVQLRREYPFLRPTSIPGDTYAGHPKPTPTIGVDTVLVCRSTLADQEVYELTRAFFEALPMLAVTQPSLRAMDLEQLPTTTIPLHRGAARFYRELELRR